MPIFMKAGSIRGEVVAESHKDWIEIDSCSFTVSFPEDDVRKSLTEGAPNPELDLFEIEKSPDGASPALMQWMLDGSELESVQIDACGDTVFKGAWRCHLRYILKKVVLTEYSVNMADAEKGAARLSLKLRFDELSMEQISYDRENTIRTRSKSVAHQRPE